MISGGGTAVWMAAAEWLVDINRKIEEQLDQLPDHQQFIDDYCKTLPS